MQSNHLSVTEIKFSQMTILTDLSGKIWFIIYIQFYFKRHLIYSYILSFLNYLSSIYTKIYQKIDNIVYTY